MLQFITNKVAGGARRQTIKGRSVLVAPVVMLVEGVHCGSRGCLYYPSDELARNVADWNGVPVTIQHPAKDGRPVSAKESPETMVGVVLNAEWDASTRRLRAEVYFDEQRLRRIAPHVLNRALSGQPIEVSTGLFTEDDSLRGTWNGEEYVGIARNYSPDHLAILPDQVGACSIAKGCGFPVHNESEAVMCSCNDDVVTPFGVASDRPYVEPVPIVNAADDDGFDLSPPSTFNAQQYETEHARKERRSPQPVVNTSDDGGEYSMIPPSTYSRFV